MDKEIQIAVGLWMCNGMVFLARRAEGERHAGKWEFPGGKLEPGETPEKAVVREWGEELSIDVTPGERVCHFKMPEIDLGQGEYGVHVFNLTKTCRGSATLKVHDDFEWVLPNDLADFDILKTVDVIVRTLGMVR